MAEAAYGLALKVDQYIAGLYTDAASAVGSAGTPVAPTATSAVGSTAYDYLVDLSTKLDEAEAPQDGRWAIVPSWFEGLLLKDTRFIASGDATAAVARLNGSIGTAAGFSILKSNSVSNNGTTSGSTYRILAGVAGAITLAEQMRKVEAYRPERRFADAVKGLHLWGAKTMRPNFLAVMYVNRP